MAANSYGGPEPCHVVLAAGNAMIMQIVWFNLEKYPAVWSRCSTVTHINSHAVSFYVLTELTVAGCTGAQDEKP